MSLLLLHPLLVLCCLLSGSLAFTLLPPASRPQGLTRCGMADPPIILVLRDDDEDDDEEEEEDDDDDLVDVYQQNAASEFTDNASSSSLVSTTTLDWGGALGTLRERLDDVTSGKSQDPSHALFRYMSTQSPNQAIGSFVSHANPQVVQAMSGAIFSLLGGLSDPTMGTELLVKASGDKVASLCFQLQMTGYMFRNAEYVVALKDLMQIRGSATLDEYKDAFERLDTDGSGFIEVEEVDALLSEVYEGDAPSFEVDAFVKFFDENDDGRISWDEFERGLGAAMAPKNGRNLLNGFTQEDDDDEEPPTIEPKISGTIEVEVEDGKTIQVEAEEYVKSLKAEAQALKEALRREKLGMPPGGNDTVLPGQQQQSKNEGDVFGSVTSYIASRQGDLESLTKGISPEIVETMRKLVEFVLEGGGNKAVKNIPREQMEMEIPGSALQQLALWQLILGYRLREMEAKGDYLKLLE